MANERWKKKHWNSVPSRGGCGGFANYYGPCGDPACGSCFPGGQYACDKCERDAEDCECLACEHCGEEYDHDEWEVCPDCHCEDCGELKEDKCKCP